MPLGTCVLRTVAVASPMNSSPPRESACHLYTPSKCHYHQQQQATSRPAACVTHTDIYVYLDVM